MARTTIRGIYGADYDDLITEGLDSFSPNPRLLTRNLKKITVQPDEKYPMHRNKLNAAELLLLRVMIDYRYSSEKRVPSLAILAEEADMSYQHACRCLDYLERQGLVSVKRRNGAANQIELRPLVDRVLLLLGRKSKAQAFKEPAAAAAPDVAEQLLQYAGGRFGEVLSAPQDAHGRIMDAQQRAGWTDEQLQEQVKLSAGRALKYARGRRFNLFFADLARSAAEAYLQAERQAALDELHELENAANRAWWVEQDRDKYLRLLDTIEEKRAQLLPVPITDAAGRQYIQATS